MFLFHSISESHTYSRGGRDRRGWGHRGAQGLGRYFRVGGWIDIPWLRTQSWCRVESVLQVLKALMMFPPWFHLYRMMREEIDQFSSHVPKSPIRCELRLILKFHIKKKTFAQGTAWIGARDCQVWKAWKVGGWEEGEGQCGGVWERSLQGGWALKRPQ